MKGTDVVVKKVGASGDREGPILECARKASWRRHHQSRDLRVRKNQLQEEWG